MYWQREALVVLVAVNAVHIEYRWSFVYMYLDTTDIEIPTKLTAFNLINDKILLDVQERAKS